MTGCKKCRTPDRFICPFCAESDAPPPTLTEAVEVIEALLEVADINRQPDAPALSRAEDFLKRAKGRHG